jgi:hypothetical protein
MQDNPSFAAVNLQLPFDATVSSVQGRIVVKQVDFSSNVENSRLRKGDIIRAVSVPETREPQDASPWWKQIGRAQVPPAENGIVILDGRSVAEFNAALEANVGQASVVLIVERPVKFWGEEDGPSFWGGITLAARQDGLNPGLVPIPIPVEKDPDNGGLPPGFPRPPGFNKWSNGF